MNHLTGHIDMILNELNIITLKKKKKKRCTDVKQLEREPIRSDPQITWHQTPDQSEKICVCKKCLEIIR